MARSDWPVSIYDSVSRRPAARDEGSDDVRQMMESTVGPLGHGGIAVATAAIPRLDCRLQCCSRADFVLDDMVWGKSRREES